MMPHGRYISSVSGGSVASAYYCTSYNWNRQAVESLLTHRFEMDVLAGVISPWMWPSFFGNWNRSHVLAESFNRTLFVNPCDPKRVMTFRDLRPDRPRLLLNATDL